MTDLDLSDPKKSFSVCGAGITNFSLTDSSEKYYIDIFFTT